MMIRQYPRGLFQQHRSQADITPSLGHALPLKADIRRDSPN
jgi:hypothetical protein